jgi:site-specific recombinase XerD
MASIKKYATFLVKNGALPELPKELISPELPPTRFNIKPVVDEQKLMSLVDETSDLETKVALSIMVSTGCRIASLAALKIDDIDDNSITFHNAKGDKPYKAVLTEQTRELVKEYAKEIGDKKYLFSNMKDGVRITPEALRIRMRRKLKDKYVQSHKIRRSIATVLLKNGADLYDVKEFLNHSNINTTILYTNLSLTERKKRLTGTHPML